MPRTNPFDDGSESERMVTLDETRSDLAEFDPLYSESRYQTADETTATEDHRPGVDVQREVEEEHQPGVAVEQGRWV